MFCGSVDLGYIRDHNEMHHKELEVKKRAETHHLVVTQLTKLKAA